MVLKKNTVNHYRITEEQLTIIQTLQAQVDEMSKKGMEDQQRNEEEVRLLKEQSKELKQQLNKSKRDEQS